MISKNTNGKPDRKVVVVGLDGVPYTLLKTYMDRGLMPELSKMCTDGALYRMKSSLPEVSSVAWTNFMTGANPGQHGIFGFMEIDPQSYQYTFPNFNSLRERPLWERKGVKAVAFNIPQTYPAKPMSGVMVSGFVALDLKKATYPERTFQYLNGMGYRIDVNARLAAEDPEAFFTDVFKTFEKRKQAIEYLYDHEDWQLFIGTVTETDRLHHFFFNSATDGPYHHIFERFYKELDSFLGLMAQKAAADGAVFLTCSDHGFTPIKSEVFVNRWLAENGYLKLSSNDGLKGILPETKAFCLDPSRIYVHLESKYKRGSVSPKDCRSVVDELKGRLGAMTYEGEPVIKELYVRDEIFHGELAENGPDLYLLPHYGFDLKGAVNKDQVFSRSHFQGMHTYDDAHFFSSVPVNHENIRIENVADFISAHLDR